MANNSNNSSDSVKPGQYGGLGSLRNLIVVLKNVDGSSSIDITSLVLNISIYEDIFSPTIYGEVSIKDAVNLLNGDEQFGGSFAFPIVGEEYIEITYNVFGQDTVSRRFSVYSIKNIQHDANLKVRNYVLHFCSEEHLLDATTLIQRSWKDKQISDMVKDVLVDYLKVDESVLGGKQKKIYRIQPTRGQQQIVVPRLTPFETLNLFARRSIAEKLFESATYVFFENKDGFHFCDIEYLIQAGRQKRTNDIKTYSYYHQQKVFGEDADSPGGDDNYKNAYKTIKDFKQKHKFDTIEKLKRGYFENEAITVNLTNREVSNTVFKFIDNYEKTNAMGDPDTGKNIVYPENTLDFIATVTTQPKIAPKILGIFSIKSKDSPGKHTKTFLIPKDGTKSNAFLEEIYTNRASYMARLAQNMYTVDVYGDSSITAGDLITIELPEILGSTEPNKKDRFLSGYFLISSIHHKITSDSYHCTFDLFKNGYSSPVMSVESSPEPPPAAVFENKINLDAITNAPGA